MWSRAEKIAAYTLLFTILGVVAAWLTIPEFRRIIGLSVKNNHSTVAANPSSSIEPNDGSSQQGAQNLNSGNSLLQLEPGEPKVTCEPGVVYGLEVLIQYRAVGQPEIKDGLNLWVERVEVSKEKTVLHLACKIAGDYQGSLALKKSSEAYFVDSNGGIYDLVEDRGTYGGFFSSYWGKHEIRLHEIYRFELVFPILQYKSPFLHFKHPDFPSIKVNLEWPKSITGP